MAKRQSVDEFLRDYVEYLNGILNRTVTSSRLVLLRSTNPNSRVVARIQEGTVLPLELKPFRWLFFRQVVRRDTFNAEHRVIVEHYQYILSFSPVSRDEQSWVFRYEYDRPGKPDIPHSHLHVTAVHPRKPSLDLSRVHFPVGHVSIEQVLAALILDFGIKPVTGDPQEAISYLAESHRGFFRRRTDLDDPLFP